MQEPMNPDEMKKFAREFFETNKTAAAGVRDDEEEMATTKILPSDLRTVPRENWGEHENSFIALPPDVAAFLANREIAPLTKEEVQGMEITVETYHGVSFPWCIVCCLDPHTGRSWRYCKEAAPYKTGFILIKDIE